MAARGEIALDVLAARPGRRGHPRAGGARAAARRAARRAQPRLQRDRRAAARRGDRRALPREAAPAFCSTRRRRSAWRRCIRRRSAPICSPSPATRACSARWARAASGCAPASRCAPYRAGRHRLALRQPAPARRPARPLRERHAQPAGRGRSAGGRAVSAVAWRGDSCQGGRADTPAARLSLASLTWLRFMGPRTAPWASFRSMWLGCARATWPTR